MKNGLHIKARVGRVSPWRCPRRAITRFLPALRDLPESLKSSGQPIPIRVVSWPLGQVKQTAVYSFEQLQHRTIVLVQKAIRNVDAIVGIDP